MASEMQEQMKTRLETLKEELETGQRELEKIEQHRTYLREMMLRISGAIQVLEELLTQGEPAAGHNAPRSDEAQTTFAQANETNVLETKF